MMGRKLKQRKPLIYVFCEGESEQAYIDFLKKAFSDVAVIKYSKSTGLLDEADNKFKKDKKYKDASEVTDEIWFFFDVETSDRCKWDARLSIINRLRRLRKPSNIRVRLLMTSGCIEYWFMLSATIFSLIETAKENDLDPFRYLVWVLSSAPEMAAGDANWSERLIPAHAPESCRNLQTKNASV